jgi:Bacterial SH3 domain
MLAALVLACSSPSTKPADVPPVAPAPGRADVELAYVHASMLRLREHPRPDAAHSTLAINTRVRVLDRQDDWVRILAPDGRSGWVHRDFIATAPLTPQLVQDQIAAATTAEARLLWSERAAALSPGDAGILANLVATYRSAGKTAEADALEQSLRSEESSRFDKTFAQHAGEVAKVDAALKSATSAGQLLAVWRQARELTAAMGEPLAAVFDSVNHTFPDGDPTAMLAERMPWASIELYAEGTVPALELAPRPWLEAAARTPEAWDDGFFSLVTTAYQNASARGWTAWQRRNWDYGGCSPFGSGENLHLALLRQTDSLASVADLSDLVGPIRVAVLRDIEKPAPDEFPYCSELGQPTPTEGLNNEARQILAEVKLSADERAMLEARISSSFGRQTAP